jgi:hypothetical protein
MKKQPKKLLLKVWLIYQQETWKGHVSPPQKLNEHTWYTHQQIMYFSNEYPKHAQNMQNIHETWNEKSIILFNLILIIFLLKKVSLNNWCLPQKEECRNF